jgi:hypothetical protein
MLSSGKLLFQRDLFPLPFLKVEAVGSSKAISLQPWTGPEGSRRLRLSDFKTFGT